MELLSESVHCSGLRARLGGRGARFLSGAKLDSRAIEVVSCTVIAEQLCDSMVRNPILVPLAGGVGLGTFKDSALHDFFVNFHSLLVLLALTGHTEDLRRKSGVVTHARVFIIYFHSLLHSGVLPLFVSEDVRVLPRGARSICHQRLLPEHLVFLVNRVIILGLRDIRMQVGVKCLAPEGVGVAHWALGMSGGGVAEDIVARFH